MLGTSENVESGELFRAENKALSVYRRRNVIGPEPRLPVFPFSLDRTGGTLARREPAREAAAYGAIHQRMLELHEPPSLLVSPDDNVVHLSARAGRYLVHPGGPVTSSVFKLVREELRIGLRAAASAARDTRQTVRSKPIMVNADGDAFSVVPTSARGSSQSRKATCS